MATTHRSELVDKIADALTDEAYDGGMGVLSEEQFAQLVRTLAVTAAEVVEKEHTPTDDERELSERLVARHLPLSAPNSTAANIVRHLTEVGLLRRSEPAPTAHRCEECQTCGVHGAEHLKCCGCYDGACCQEPQSEHSDVPELPDDCDCEDREALVRPEGLVCGTCGKVIAPGGVQ